MPSIKVKCPIDGCTEQMQDKTLGCHLLSKCHRDDMLKYNPILFTLSLSIGTDRPHPFKREVPALLVSSKDKSTYSICLTCKRCWVTEKSRGAFLDHYNKYPDCFTNLKTAVNAYTTVVKKTSVNDSALLKEIDDLKKQLKKQMNEVKLYRASEEVLQEDVKNLNDIINMMAGPGACLERLKDVIDADERKGVKGRYTKDME